MIHDSWFPIIQAVLTDFWYFPEDQIGFWSPFSPGFHGWRQNNTAINALGTWQFCEKKQKNTAFLQPIPIGSMERLYICLYMNLFKFFMVNVGKNREFPTDDKQVAINCLRSNDDLQLRVSHFSCPFLV